MRRLAPAGYTALYDSRRLAFGKRTLPATAIRQYKGKRDGLHSASNNLMQRALAIFLACPALLAAQPPPPGNDPRAVERRISEIRNWLDRTTAADPDQRELATFARRYLNEASEALTAGHRFQSQRLTDAAEACRRPIEHLQRASAPTGVKPDPPMPPGDPEDRLRQVYFRLRLSDFFLQQMPPPAPVKLRDMAREFYGRAVKAEQSGKKDARREYAAAADDLTHALENLAQATLP
jgi:hypothetical protein